MARRSTSPPPKQPANLTAEKKREAISLFQRRVEDLRRFDVNSINALNDPRVTVLGQAIDEALVRVFGSDTVDYERYRWASRLRSGGFVIGGYEPSIQEIREEVEEGKQKAIATLDGIIRRFQEDLELAESQRSEADTREPLPVRTESRRVFVVHGHDEAARESVARFLERLDFAPVILHEQANRGQTVIEKVEAHSDVGFAVVLLTPDDVGGPAGSEMQPRPRQNVLLELGYFIGRLGRRRVCAFKRGEMEIPTDFGGVVWEAFDGTAGGWKQRLGKELEAAGFEVDWNRLMRS